MVLKSLKFTCDVVENIRNVHILLLPLYVFLNVENTTFNAPTAKETIGRAPAFGLKILEIPRVSDSILANDAQFAKFRK